MRYRRLAPIALIALFGAACSGSDPNAPSPTPTPTHSPRTTAAVHSTSAPPTTQNSASSPSIATTGPNVRPGEKPPKMPAIAKKHSSVGAEEFARYWFHALDWGYATTDSTLAKSLFVPTCRDCARFMKNFDVPRQKHEHFEGGRSNILSTAVVARGHRHPITTVIDVTLKVEALKTLDAEGDVVSRAPPIGRLTYRLWLRWLGSGWKVLDTKQVVRQ